MEGIDLSDTEYADLIHISYIYVKVLLTLFILISYIDI